MRVCSSEHKISCFVIGTNQSYVITFVFYSILFLYDYSFYSYFELTLIFI